MARKEGHAEGRAEGLEEGLKEGLEQGREEGREETLKEMVLNLYENNVNIDTICKYTKLSNDNVKNIIFKK